MFGLIRAIVLNSSGCKFLKKLNKEVPGISIAGASCENKLIPVWVVLRWKLLLEPGGECGECLFLISGRKSLLAAGEGVTGQERAKVAEGRMSQIHGGTLADVVDQIVEIEHCHYLQNVDSVILKSCPRSCIGE